MTTITAASATIIIPSFTTFSNLGPLPPTSFPGNCLSDLWDMNTYGFGVPWTYETQGCAVKTCCPSGNFYTEPWAWMTSYYSPGVCPSQYRSCAAPSSPTALSSASGEEIVFCCPTNYGCPQSKEFFQFCQSLLSTSTEVIVMDNIFDQMTLSTRPFVLASGMVNSFQAAYPIQVRSKPGDTFASTTASVTSSNITPTGVIQASRTGSPDTVTSTPSRSGLSTGAIVGIAFGSLGVICFLLAGAFFFIYKTRLLRQTSARRTMVPGQYVSDGFPKSELDSQTANAELDSQTANVELDSQKANVELDSQKANAEFIRPELPCHDYGSPGDSSLPMSAVELPDNQTYGRTNQFNR